VLNDEQKAKSDAYFENGYYLDLLDTLIMITIAAFLLFGGVSRGIRDLAKRISQFCFDALTSVLHFIHAPAWLVNVTKYISHWAFFHTVIFIAMYFLAMFILTLPWNIYMGFFREHSYGLATQNFGDWFSETLIGLVVGIAVGSVVLAVIYSAVRRIGKSWWAWTGGILFVFMIFMQMLYPVFISPLFNEYKPLPAGELRDGLLSMARASQIPADNIYVFDASKQTTRVSANVSGMMGTTRISLNDNLLNRTSPEEIRAVMGHEMGHYVLNHSLRLVVYLTLVLVFGLLFVHFAYDGLLKRYGTRWGVSDRGDPAGLPLAAALLAIFMTVMTPLNNSIIRQAEAEADAFGLAVAGEPHGFATVAMRLSTYRKIHPGELEEIMFYDHPSGYARVHRAMAWLKENQQDSRVIKAMQDNK
ncbi:MAG: M48 family metallopeptidase, partial [Arenimonas sp.]